MVAIAGESVELTPQTASPPRHSRRGDPRAARSTPSTIPTALPEPPNDQERYVFGNRNLWVLTLSSLVSFGCLVVSQILFINMSAWLLLLLPFLAFTVLYYIISLFVNLLTFDFDMKRHRRLVQEWSPALYPSIDVFLPVCGEPLDVLRNTWQHVYQMIRHYDGRVHVYVLDDSANDERENAALGFNFVYQRRPNRGWYKKAGNMRYAYQRTLSEFILVLDADFTPRHDMLNEMLPYFDAEPGLGIVQSPQYFRVTAAQGWLERGAGAVQELFYRTVQVSRQRHGAAICVGSCALYRREALDSIGGSTLIEHSEDVHTGFDMRRQGWRLLYIPVPLAAGLCPADVNSFFTQQYRWCAGSMSLLTSTKFWNTRLGVRARFSYLSGFCYYAHTAVFTFVGPLIPIVMLVRFPEFVELNNYLLIVPSMIYNMIVFPLWHKCTFGFESWTVKMIYGWAHTFAIWDAMLGRSVGWQPTGDTGRKNRVGRLWVGMAVWTGGTALVWTAVAAERMITTSLAAFAPAFIGGVLFLTIALQALLINPRKDIRGMPPDEVTLPIHRHDSAYNPDTCIRRPVATTRQFEPAVRGRTSGREAIGDATTRLQRRAPAIAKARLPGRCD